ncbi:MAG: hypothetical protein J5789_07560 [Oscillospiraceae bacterium]|nr:hypothetical protein [Oscillospiraceae bacterium]
MSHNPPAPSYPEIVNDLQERKSPRIYKADNAEFTDQRISDLVRTGTAELARIADGTQAVNLTDTDTVKRRTMIYLRACEEVATIPSMSGLARSFGLSTEALNKHRRQKPNSETSVWLEICHDAFADMMAESALRGTVQPVVAIFTLKARSGWRDTLTIEQAPINNPLGDSRSQEELLNEYLNEYTIDERGAGNE